jgi:hypothetical protein
MDYSAIYNRIISNRKANPYNGYVEEHHVIPRCLGGTDEKNNLVKLRAKEHFICHLLLTRMCTKRSPEYYKVVHAFMMMKNAVHNERYISGHSYEDLRVAYSIRMSELCSGSGNSQHGTMWIYNPILKENTKVSKNSVIETGWYRGRVINWETHASQLRCATCGKQSLPTRDSTYCSRYCKLNKKKNGS